MERVGVLITKLQEQYHQNADASQLLITVQMLMKELQSQPVNGHSHKVAVILPNNHFIPASSNTASSEDLLRTVTSIPTAIVEEAAPITPIIEKEEVAAQVVNGEHRIPSGFLNQWYSEAPPEIPTLIHQQKTDNTELNDAMASNDESLNERLRIEKIELASILQETPIRDLKKAIGVNDRYTFINELFKGDETTYERSIKTINDFHIYAEAEYWIKRELKLKYAWSDNNETVKRFDQLVKRRFS